MKKVFLKWVAMLLLFALFSMSLTACGTSNSSTINASDENGNSQSGNGISIIDNRNKGDLDSPSPSASEPSTPKSTSTPPKPTPTPVPATPEPTKSPGVDVYEAFVKATTLQKKDLKTDTAGAYCYKGIRLSVKDAGDIFGDYVIAQCAIYNGVARKMEQICANDGALFNSSEGEFYQILLGEDKPESYEEFKALVRTLEEYIVYDPTEREIFHAFEALDCVDGEIDTANRKYSFTINDLTKAAASLHVSEEMLGYMLAYATIYTPLPEQAFQWSDNSVTINLNIGIPPKNPPIRSYDVDNPTYIYTGEFNYCCSDFTYALNDVLMRMDRNLRTLKSSSDGHVSWIYNVNDRNTAVVTILFTGADEHPDADDEFRMFAGSVTLGDDWVTAVMGMIMASDPKLSFDEAKELGTALIEGLKKDTVSTKERDGLTFVVMPLSSTELSVWIGVKQ
ncbi:MAG: hypothetical protein IJ594_07960 [Oscillospiraceae bacterium]|nr:hypothetical protein [Oscillospiraceae bacterium]